MIQPAEAKAPATLRLYALNRVVDRDEAARIAIQKAFGLRFDDPHRMVEWASLAVELAASSRVSALAHGHLGNALRIRGDFAAAARELERAGQGRFARDPLLLELKSSLQQSVGDHPGAIVSLRSVAQAQDGEDDRDRQPRILAKVGLVLSETGHREEAAEVFQAALESVVADESVGRAAVFGLAGALASSQPGRALAVLDKARPLFEGSPTLVRLKMTWLRGRIAMTCRDDELALTNLAEAHDGFRGVGLLHESSLIVLDRAVHEWRCGRARTAFQLVEPIPALLTRLGAPAQASKAAAVRNLMSLGGRQELPLP